MNSVRIFTNQRNSILSDTNLVARVIETAEDYIETFITAFLASNRKGKR